MAFDGNGTFNRLYSWVADRNAGINIDATRSDNEDNGFATGLSTCMTKDGQSTPTANLKMGGFKFTNIGSGSARTDSIQLGQAQDGAIWDAGTTGGTATAYTATLSPAISAYADKQFFRVQFNAACGLNPTINFNAVGAKKIYKNVAGTATQVGSGEILANYIATLRYDTALDTGAGGFWLVNQIYYTTPTTTRGDLIYRGASADTRLAIGAANTILSTDGTDPVWRTLTAEIDTIGSTQGQILYRGAAAWSVLATGTSGQVLKTGGAGADPSWFTLPFTKSFTSADQTITSAGLLTLAHGMGTAPLFVQLRLKNISTEAGWSAGDEFIINNNQQDPGGAAGRGCAVYFDATNVYVRFASDPNAFAAINKTTGGNTALTNSKWSLVVRAWA